MLNILQIFLVNRLVCLNKSYGCLFTVGKCIFSSHVSRYNRYNSCLRNKLSYNNICNCFSMLVLRDSLNIIHSLNDMTKKSKKSKKRKELKESKRLLRLELKYLRRSDKKFFGSDFVDGLRSLKEKRKILKKEEKFLMKFNNSINSGVSLEIEEFNSSLDNKNELLKIHNRFYIDSIEEAVANFVDFKTLCERHLYKTGCFNVNENSTMDPSKENNFMASNSVGEMVNIDEAEKLLRDSIIKFSEHMSQLKLEELPIIEPNVSSNSAEVHERRTYNKTGKEKYEEEIFKELRTVEYTIRGQGIIDEPFDPNESKFKFSVMSYNVLSQTLLEDNMWLYKGHNPAYLNWTHRSKLLMKEILEYNCDILCLQEVDVNHKVSFFDQLEEQGYKSIYKQRTHGKPDGCAIYYKTSKFTLIDYRSVEYFQNGISILDRDNIGLIAKLHPVGYPSQPIVVATTHLLYNPRRHDVKLAQVVLLLAELERIAFHDEYAEFKYHPTIVTGDFNLEPFSGVYELIMDGQLQYEFCDRKTLMFLGSMPQTQLASLSAHAGRPIPLGKQFLPPSLGITDECQHYKLSEMRKGANIQLADQDYLIGIYNSDVENHPMLLNNTENLRHLFGTGTLKNTNFDFHTVYYHRDYCNISEATTKHNDYVNVDYLLYTPLMNKRCGHNQLQLVSRQRIPTIPEWRKHIRNIPNRICPSDHIPLAATFFLRVSPKDSTN